MAEEADPVEVRAGAVTGSRKEDAFVSVCALARDQSSVHTVGGYPLGDAIADERGELRIRRHAPRSAEMRRRRIMRRHKKRNRSRNS